MFPINLTTKNLSTDFIILRTNSNNSAEPINILEFLSDSSNYYNNSLFETFQNKNSIIYANGLNVQHLNSLFKEEYFPILLFLFISIILSLIILIFSYLLAVQNPDTEKLSAYECGFDPYEDARHTFDVRFYLVAILFIIFDIETMFLFPWALSLSNLTSLGFWAMVDFLIELGIGFLYAWKIGALEWE